jgi:hypothetical protein
MTQIRVVLAGEFQLSTNRPRVLFRKMCHDCRAFQMIPRQVAVDFTLLVLAPDRDATPPNMCVYSRTCWSILDTMPLTLGIRASLNSLDSFRPLMRPPSVPFRRAGKW